MKMLKRQLCILLIICIRNSLCAIDFLYDIGQELWKLHSMIDNIKLETTEYTREAHNLLIIHDLVNQEIINQMDKIYEELHQIEESIGVKLIEYPFELYPLEIMLHERMDRLGIFIQDIDKYYEEFHSSMNGSNSNLPMRVLIEKIVVNVEGHIEIIRNLVTKTNEFLPKDKNLILGLTSNAILHQTEICNDSKNRMGKTMSKILVHLFTMVIIAEIKVNIMVAFANVHRYMHAEAWKSLNTHARNKFRQQFGAYVNLFERNLNSTDTLYLRACDPDHGTWTRGKSFYELEGTIQTSIFRHHWAACKHDSCNDVWFKKQYQCHPTIYDIRSSCSNRVAECIYLSTVQACVLKTGPYKFQFVNSTALGLLGRNFRCPKTNGYLITDGAGWDYNYATCACNCYGDHNKISLSIIESRIELNMVITGLRFYRKDSILYLQPREGKLNGNGDIHQFSQKWVPIPSRRARSEIHSIDKWNRIFFLDDVRLPPNFVLTGVKFNKVTRKNVSGFAIEIFGVPFDYKSGKLDIEREHRISVKAPNQNSGDPLSFEPISSVHTTLPTKVTPGSTKYISLERSRLHDDFGQSTVPFFDAVPIIIDRVVLGGMGIFHKGVEGYAGFISLRVYSIHYVEYFEDFIWSRMTESRVLFDVSRDN